MSLAHATLILFLSTIDCLLITPRTPTPYAVKVTPRAAVSAAFGDAAWQRNLQATGAATLASLVLIASPMTAHAKGGGHGGGGHSSSHSSSSHSSSSSMRTLHSYRGVTRSSRSSSRSRRRTSQSSFSSSAHHRTAVASPPPPVVLYPDKSAARRENGYYCPANLPRPGERVYVQQENPALPKRKATVISSQVASQASLYGSSASMLQPVPGFESDCSVCVQYDDGMIDSVSAAEQPVPAAVEFAENALAATALVGYGAAMSMSGGDSAWDSAKDRRDELLEEMAAMRRVDGPPPARPRSGEYWGASDESDEGDQAVRTTLTFNDDGSISGRGVDGVDGSYRITRGKWGALRDQTDDSKLTVTWTEVYDEGFQLVVEGRYDARTAKIHADFTSSRGIRGRFELKPRPSVF